MQKERQQLLEKVARLEAKVFSAEKQVSREVSGSIVS